MKIGIIIQARMGSTRLPGKILKPFYKENALLNILLNNLHKVQGCKVIVATSDNPNNDDLVSFLHKRDELVFRGPENDVLNRFILAAEKFEVDGIVRICSDNPFLDYHGVSELVEKAKCSVADYIGFRINNLPSIKTHFGFWGEFVKLEALKRVADSTPIESPAHEHVTIHIYTHPEEYKCEWIECPSYLQGREDIRLTVDNKADFENAQNIYSALFEANPNFGLKDVVAYIDSNYELRESMKKMISLNTK